jgi:hypothetical protein
VPLRCPSKRLSGDWAIRHRGGTNPKLPCDLSSGRLSDRGAKTVGAIPSRYLFGDSGAADSASFWKRGFLRSGSHIGSYAGRQGLILPALRANAEGQCGPDAAEFVQPTGRCIRHCLAKQVDCTDHRPPRKPRPRKPPPRKPPPRKPPPRKPPYP